MTADQRAALKFAILQRLSEVATEHPAGHQGKLAARFVFRSHDGEGIELMFEKGRNSPPNLWMHQERAELLMTSGIDHRKSEAATLYAVTNEMGKKTYGRHAALLAMHQLANADLVRFKLTSLDELEMMIETLRRC